MAIILTILSFAVPMLIDFFGNSQPQPQAAAQPQQNPLNDWLLYGLIFFVILFFCCCCYCGCYVFIVQFGCCFCVYWLKYRKASQDEFDMRQGRRPPYFGRTPPPFQSNISTYNPRFSPNNRNSPANRYSPHNRYSPDNRNNPNYMNYPPPTSRHNPNYMNYPPNPSRNSPNYMNYPPPTSRNPNRMDGPWQPQFSRNY